MRRMGLSLYVTDRSAGCWVCWLGRRLGSLLLVVCCQTQLFHGEVG